MRDFYLALLMKGMKPEMAAEHVGGVTAWAVTVTGVETELPFAGTVIVTIPFEVDPKECEASSDRTRTRDSDALYLRVC